MDLSVRDWLIIIGSLLALAVLLDGYRRMHKDRSDTIRLTPKARSEVDDGLVNPELPGGSARVIAVREQPSLHVKRAPTSAAAPRKEPPLNVAADDDDDILFRDPAEEYARKVVDDSDDLHDVDAGWSGELGDDEELVQPERSETKPLAATAERRPEKEGSSLKSAQATPSAHQELIVLNVMSPTGKPFKGNDLLQILMACDVRYGKMNIFHRYENADGSGQIQFSVANLVEPGNFDLDEIDEFSTPGVVFFMHLPGPADSMKAYEAMVETARCLVKNLEGELRDQTHSVATKQTLEHYKQRIRDFERRQLTLM
ncbi:cell division protein ZipA [Zhongshania antarctica]|uniref:Cell division protein ZipA n=1 Tax=Zhongshania antarctica TaxID=641702 RepID=A0A840QZM8_9GAMM|nr:cell division protein ZipA [Zhongshania antarctica]MBB5185784.1 cell division protein ZipA [Zhongshania antarctica]